MLKKVFQKKYYPIVHENTKNLKLMNATNPYDQKRKNLSNWDKKIANNSANIYEYPQRESIIIQINHDNKHND